MRNVLLLLLVASVSVSVLSYQNVAPADGSAMAVLEYKWSKTRLLLGTVDPGNPPPALLVSRASKNYERNKPNEQRGTRDPQADTYEGRSAAMEQSIQDSRAPKPVDGFAYRIKLENKAKKAADIIFWEYQFIDPANPAVTARRQFLCAVQMKPGKETPIEAFSVSGPVEVVSVKGLADSSGKPLQEKVVVNRVEYVDGSIWRRKDWNFGEIKQAYDRALSTPWAKEMCRPL
ncbi:MAG: hypothetical protein ABJB97_10550 [Acidobacteriota bacterium]